MTPNFTTTFARAEAEKLRSLEEGFFRFEGDAEREQAEREAYEDRGCDDGRDEL